MDPVLTNGKYLWSCDHHIWRFHKSRAKQRDASQLTVSPAAVETTCASSTYLSLRSYNPYPSYGGLPPVWTPVPLSLRSYNPYPSYGGLAPPKVPNWGGMIKSMRRSRKLRWRRDDVD
jgi:hypothetical protein